MRSTLPSFALRALTLGLLALLALAAPARAQTTVQIHDIMVAGSSPIVGTAATKTLPYSPYYGQTVSVSGIVVGVMSGGDYPGTAYISEPSSSWESLVLTAEGLPVFGLKSLNAACAVVGATVTIVGQVVLSTAVVPADITAAGTPGTGVLPTSCAVTATNGTMTQSISVGSVLTAFGDALKYTGMTTSATFYAVAPTTGTLAESTETETSTGQFWATLSADTATNNHLFRSRGIAGDEYTPSAAPANNSTASAPLASYVSTVTQPHFTADFAATNANSSTTPAGLTPHDGFVVAFLIPPVPTTASLSPTTLNFGSLDIGASTSLTLTVTNTTTFASTVNVSNIAVSGANATDGFLTHTATYSLTVVVRN